MSGTKQHHIPQFLLKAFGIPKGKAVHVTTYTSERGIYTAATEKIGAGRDFYSEKSSNGSNVQTLDDKITAYENNTLLPIWREFVALPNSTVVNGQKAAELVTHLCVRPSHVRKSFAYAADKVWENASSLFLDTKRARDFFQIDANRAHDILEEELQKVYDQLSLVKFRIPLPLFRQLAMNLIRQNFDTLYINGLPNLQNVFSAFSQRLGDVGKGGHCKGLNRSLAPEPRVEVLCNLQWQVMHTSLEILLPDCVAINIHQHTPRPLFFLDKDTIDTIYLPLSSNSILIGGGSVVSEDLASVNAALASCAWDCFYAKKHTPEFEALIPYIQTRTKSLIHDGVKAAFENG